ncbi:MAG: hypothetical protein K8S22_06275 [Betaproteobacteria bacterium]|nr:hypothetical protein [Betaproteobacteria bacterium]
METTPDSAPPSPMRIPVTVVLAVVATPLALVAWIALSGGQRPAYLRSAWIRAGIVTVAVGAAPLLAVIAAAAVGIWPDPNPNPIGLGLLFLGAGVLACILTLIGIIRVATRP